MDHRMILELLDMGVSTAGVRPVRAADLQPPRRGRRPPQDVGRVSGHRQMEDRGGLEPFGVGAVTGGGDEPGELFVGDGGCVDVEHLQRDFMQEGFAVVGIALAEGVAHHELPRRDRDVVMAASR